MTGILRVLLTILLLAATVLAQSKRDGDGIKMQPRPGKTEEGKKEGERKEPEKELPPFEAALEKLKTWPAAEALDAAATLALEGPEGEKRLIDALKTATPAQAAGIAFVLGEIGGDASVPALQAIAARPAMSDHLKEIFVALGLLTIGFGVSTAARRISRFRSF